MTTTKSIPWYRKFKEYFLCGLNNIDSYIKWDSKPDYRILRNFELETLARFIFESNNIEKEGLSFGETKKLVLYDLDVELKKSVKRNLSSVFELFHQMEIPVKVGVIGHPEILKQIGEIDLEELEKVNLSLVAKYEGHSKDAMTVVRHYIATQLADNQTITFSGRRLLFNVYQNAISINKEKKFLKEFQESIKLFFPGQKVPTYPSLLNEEFIKNLHEKLATGLIDSTSTPAGIYRTHPIMTDYESHYPAPESIEIAMKKFLKDFERLEKKNINPISLAAWASTQFVLIHPFSDFNGRVSRIIMNMILRVTRVPFWTSLRSNKKDRKRYHTALMHYRRGKKFSIATLISIQICSIINDLNQVLDTSGLPLMPILEIPQEVSQLSETELWKSVDPTLLKEESD